jgi:hypothetical protein
MGPGPLQCHLKARSDITSSGKRGLSTRTKKNTESEARLELEPSRQWKDYTLSQLSSQSLCRAKMLNNLLS